MNRQLWKNAGLRALVGAPIGLAISTVITIIISFAIGKGEYFAVVPELASDFGSEVNAVLIQALCSMLYGAAFAGASVIWDTDWSLTKMTVVHLLVISLTMLPIAYLMRWMNRTVRGVLLYIVFFLVLYAIIWIISYRRTQRQLREINKKLNA